MLQGEDLVTAAVAAVAAPAVANNDCGGVSEGTLSATEHSGHAARVLLMLATPC